MVVHFHSLGWTTSQKAKQSRSAWSSLREAYILCLLSMRQRSYFGSEDGRINKKKSVAFPCKAQSMVEACVNGKSHFRLQFSECFNSFPSMCARDQHSQSRINVSMVFLSLIPAGSLNKLQKQSIVLRVSLLRFDLSWSFPLSASSSCSPLHRYIFLLPGISSLTSSPLVFCCHRVIVFMQGVWSDHRVSMCVCVWGGGCS